MNKSGPVIVIEDDVDDQELLTEIFRQLNYDNEIVFFFDGLSALEYMRYTDVVPFLVLSDINMPGLNGLELKQKIQTEPVLRAKCVPYLFFTTSASRQSVVDAYSMSAQGFFEKDNSMAELEKTIRVIMEYWMRCHSPNQYPF